MSDKWEPASYAAWDPTTGKTFRVEDEYKMAGDSLFELAKGFGYASVHREAERGPFRAFIHRSQARGASRATMANLLINLRRSKGEANEKGGTLSFTYEEDPYAVGGYEMSAQLYIGNGHWIGWRINW
jgi:hypothetical protein